MNCYSEVPRMFLSFSSYFNIDSHFLAAILQAQGTLPEQNLCGLDAFTLYHLVSLTSRKCQREQFFYSHTDLCQVINILLKMKHNTSFLFYPIGSLSKTVISNKCLVAFSYSRFFNKHTLDYSRFLSFFYHHLPL